jgi:RNA polymerase sigma-70 factor (sigma-E family)
MAVNWWRGDEVMSSVGEAEYISFVRTRSTALLRTAYLLTGDHGHAEDLVQTALAKAYVARGRIREPRALEAYVRRTLVTTAISWRRKRSWRGERPIGEHVDRSVPAGTDELDERARVWSVVQALPARQRAVIVLRFYEDLTEAQTATVLGCSVGTVKAQAHRALARLRAVLGEAEPLSMSCAVREEDR